nr:MULTISPECIES: DUF3429 domain-containing protein [unclassified Pseudoalteromonas]
MAFSPELIELFNLRHVQLGKASALRSTLSIARYINHIQLGYLGLLPFLALVGWSMLSGRTEYAGTMFIYYGIAIMSFLAGQLWRPGEQSYGRAIAAVIPTIPLPLLALGNELFTLAWLSASFWLVLAIEVKQPQWAEHHKDYRKMRFVLTSVVFVCHLLMIAAMLDRP